MSLGCDSNIPLVAQELMKKMIHQFALEYASKCLLHTSTNGVTTRTSSPPPDASDAPLDLTVSRTQGEKGSNADPGRKIKEFKRSNSPFVGDRRRGENFCSVKDVGTQSQTTFFFWFCNSRSTRPLQQKPRLPSHFKITIGSRVRTDSFFHGLELSCEGNA